MTIPSTRMPLSVAASTRCTDTVVKVKGWRFGAKSSLELGVWGWENTGFKFMVWGLVFDWFGD